MSPKQRIQKVLHSRGREVTAEEVESWILSIQCMFKMNKGIDVPPSVIADGIEDGGKMLTMFLHCHFGDSLGEKDALPQRT